MAIIPGILWREDYLRLGLNIPIGSSIELINPVGVVYGEYHNRLSLTADDVKVIAAAKE